MMRFAARMASCRSRDRSPTVGAMSGTRINAAHGSALRIAHQDAAGAGAPKHQAKSEY